MQTENGQPLLHVNQIPKDTLLEIKRRNDKNGKKREWMSNVYLSNNGQVMLGQVVEGDYNGVKVTPEVQDKKDRVYTGMVECVGQGLDKQSCKAAMQQYGAPGGKFGVGKENQVTTIHMHPISPFETKTGEKVRQKFSGTDIGSEVSKSIRDDKHRQMWLTFPAPRGNARHNVVMNVIFPGRETFDIIKKSNPHLSQDQIMAISPQGENIDMVDWAAYQKEAEARGYVEKVDIEDATGTEAYASYGNYYAGFAVAGVIATIIIVYIINKKLKKKAT